MAAVALQKGYKDLMAMLLTAAAAAAARRTPSRAARPKTLNFPCCTVLSAPGPPARHALPAWPRAVPCL